MIAEERLRQVLQASVDRVEPSTNAYARLVERMFAERSGTERSGTGPPGRRPDASAAAPPPEPVGGLQVDRPTPETPWRYVRIYVDRDHRVVALLVADRVP